MHSGYYWFCMHIVGVIFALIASHMPDEKQHLRYILLRYILLRYIGAGIAGIGLYLLVM